MKQQVFNPYMPSWEYVPDGEPHVFGERVYVYGSHDEFRGAVFCLGDYVCYSAPVDNLKDWKYEGVIYPKVSDPLNQDGSMCLYAPDVTQGPDGKYYLYYVLDHVSVVSVAVCDTPAGKYQFLGYVHYEDGTKLGDKEGDEPQFDPAVITEGEFTYLYTGFCGPKDQSRSGARVCKLASDMLTIVNEPETIVPGSVYSAGTGYDKHAFFEASSIRKFGDLYYFVYSSEVMHELCYATSKYPDKDFVYGGVVVSNTDLHIDSYKPADMPAAAGANNHGGIVKVGDTYYIFYHRHTDNTWYSRQGCAEKLTINEDGTIVQPEMTSCGLNGGPLEGVGEYPAYIACNLFNEKKALYLGEQHLPHITQDGRDGDEELGYIVDITNTTTIGFKYFELKNVKKFAITTRGYGNGCFEIRTSWDGECLGKIDIGYINIWTRYETEVALPDGVSAIYLVYVGDGNKQLKSFELIQG